eukprot:m.280548 g.280548  ORF g.280548 m.280548 type:complete len:139 (-) comp15750_c0_seq9:1739-2155(-)
MSTRHSSFVLKSTKWLISVRSLPARHLFRSRFAQLMRDQTHSLTLMTSGMFSVGCGMILIRLFVSCVKYVLGQLVVQQHHKPKPLDCKFQLCVFDLFLHFCTSSASINPLWFVLSRHDGVFEFYCFDTTSLLAIHQIG